MVYSAGMCPVCADSGALIFAINIASGDPFVLCPSCGVAWSNPDDARTVDTVYSIKEFATEGFRMATRSEIETAGWDSYVTHTYRDDEWPIESLNQ